MMHTALLPGWLRVMWIVASCAVAAVHLHHVRVMRAQHRFWHVGHVLMATGMAYMYLPHAAHVLPSAAGTAVFAVAAMASIGVAVVLWLRDGVLNPLWILITVETGVMAYMFLPMNTRSALLSTVLAVYLAGIGLLWAVGRWDRHYRSDGVLALRVSLVTMAGAMAYMLMTM